MSLSPIRQVLVSLIIAGFLALLASVGDSWIAVSGVAAGPAPQATGGTMPVITPATATPPPATPLPPTATPRPATATPLPPTAVPPPPSDGGGESSSPPPPPPPPPPTQAPPAATQVPVVDVAATQVAAAHAAATQAAATQVMATQVVATQVVATQVMATQIEATRVAGTPVPTLPVPPAPTPVVGRWVVAHQPASMPAGLPPVPEGGVVWIIPPMDGPGFGLVRLVFDGREVEVRIANDQPGQSLVVVLRPVGTPPPGAALEGRQVARYFAVDILRYDQAGNTASPLSESDRNRMGVHVLEWRVSAEEWAGTFEDTGAVRPIEGEAAYAALSLSRLLAGSPHPQRLAFYRIDSRGQVVKVQTTWRADPAPFGTLTAVFKGEEASTFALVVLPPGEEGRTVPVDDRYFQPTGFRVGRDAFWDYFQKRGGVGTFGYPVSRELTLLGFPVQFFQRAILQAMPDGSVARMNLLDEGLMPYSRINASVFPRAGREMSDAAPSPADAEYAVKALAFIEANVPDEWERLKVNFRQTFLSTVRPEDAFPRGDGDPALLPLLNLELWGLPTSRPAYDPGNQGFVYQRFQRGILHYDAATGATQGLLLADYLKSIMTGMNLPADLEEQARTSPFFKQYDRTKPDHLARPADLAATSLVQAFESDLPEEVAASLDRPGPEAVASATAATPDLLLIPLLGFLMLAGGARARATRRRTRG